MDINVVVQPSAVGMRLDAFLSTLYPPCSRARVGKLVKSKQIKVNGLFKKSSYKLKQNDLITGQMDCRDTDLPPRPSQTIPLAVLYEDRQILVIDKPPGLVVHPGAGHSGDTLVNALLHCYPDIENVGDDPKRPGIVHRLDKDTSGVMVVALTEDSFVFLKKEFMCRRVKKRYLAYVSGNLEDESGRIVMPIGRHPVKRKMMSILDEKGRYAETHWQVRHRFDGVDFIEVTLMTGRTHQIRVHFKALGHPLIGDSIYGKKRKERGGRKENHGKESDLKNMERHVERQMLHAWELSFRHPWSGRRMDFTAPLPEDMARYLSLDMSTK